MDIPPQLELAISSNEAAPPAGLIIGMRVSAGTKNPYHIFFPKTDATGLTALDRAAILGQFKDHWEEGLMDFNGTLESAAQEVTFFLFNSPALEQDPSYALAWPLLTHEKTVWHSRAEKVSYFVNSCNSRYNLPEAAVKIPVDGLVRLQVQRR